MGAGQHGVFIPNMSYSCLSIPIVKYKEQVTEW